MAAAIQTLAQLALQVICAPMVRMGLRSVTIAAVGCVMKIAIRAANCKSTSFFSTPYNEYNLSPLIIFCFNNAGRIRIKIFAVPKNSRDNLFVTMDQIRFSQDLRMETCVSKLQTSQLNFLQIVAVVSLVLIRCAF